MTAEDFPLFLWSGDPPGSTIDEENEYDHIFRGYYLERVHFISRRSNSLR